MAETTNSHNAYTLARLDHLHECIVRCCACALEWSCMFTCETMWNLVEIRFFTNIVLSKRPVIEVCLSKDTSLVAPNVSCSKAIAAMSARISVVASACSFADFKLGHVAPDGFDYTDTFMTEGDTIWNVGQVCGADTRVRDSDKYVLRSELWLLSKTGLDYTFDSTEDCVLGYHGYC
jgi:hypothetical protein